MRHSQLAQTACTSIFFRFKSSAQHAYSTSISSFFLNLDQVKISRAPPSPTRDLDNERVVVIALQSVVLVPHHVQTQSPVHRVQRYHNEPWRERAYCSNGIVYHNTGALEQSCRIHVVQVLIGSPLMVPPMSDKMPAPSF